jgi:hypothetical protein
MKRIHFKLSGFSFQIVWFYGFCYAVWLFFYLEWFCTVVVLYCTTSDIVFCVVYFDSFETNFLWIFSIIIVQIVSIDQSMIQSIATCCQRITVCLSKCALLTVCMYHLLTVNRVSFRFKFLGAFFCFTSFGKKPSLPSDCQFDSLSVCALIVVWLRNHM